jgi:hypothetical protein
MGRWLAAWRWMRQDLLLRSLCVLCKRIQELRWSLCCYEQGVGRYDIRLCVVWTLFDRASFPLDIILV